MVEHDLIDLLSLNERSELVSLISKITEAMRSRLDVVFNSKERKSRLMAMSQRNPNLPETTEDRRPASPIRLEGTINKTPDVNTIEREVSSKLLEIKPAALGDFDRWQEALFHRIIETIYKEEGPSETADIKTDHSGDQLPRDPLKHWLPRIETPLAHTVNSQKRPLIIHAIILLSISLETYDPRSRVLLLQLCNSLNVPVSVLLQQESATAHILIVSAQSQANQNTSRPSLPSNNQLNADSYVKQRDNEGLATRRWKIGLATVGGALLVGVTGGLAAPLVAAGLGTLLGGIGLGGTVAAGYLGAMAASAPLVGGLFGAYGGKLSGDMMKRYAQEVNDFAFLPLNPKLESKLRVTVCVSGWLTKESQITSPWVSFNEYSNVYALRWEMQALLDLGSALDTFVKQYAIGYIKSEVIKRTVLASLWSALWPIGLLKFAQVVDNPFSIAKTRAEKAGLVLADAIIHRAQGKRPVTLVGYSLGARLIYSCLMSLAERKAFGLLDTVVLMGAPVPSATESWALMRSVVSGRLVNVYCADDWVLGFLYRTSAIQLGVAGLQEVEGVEGVENFDAGHIIDGHMKYADSVNQILISILDADLYKPTP
ncbi:hypothetical protein M408DRAFT_70680 [Serendipita vermifera MAFF 305830]|uniref:DUF726-domain-containing protein n=1 Tax=Serendipita vermifera MAFF 305830 TaxID=933852 RepID=A0A0C3B713_SERVB|nr:hypothetical protein M408DRAFT_26624 [Serendipita vermifera MAFF 305830]KIM27944.1 hypothetical protein M408DRAFT_70680 [Serendipita vermifera MAFF 305830]